MYLGVQTFPVRCDYLTSHNAGVWLGGEYLHVLSCILLFPKKTRFSVRELHSVTMAWSKKQSHTSSRQNLTDFFCVVFSALDCFPSLSLASFFGISPRYWLIVSVFGGELRCIWRNLETGACFVSQCHFPPILQVQSKPNVMHPLPCDNEMKLSSMY